MMMNKMEIDFDSEEICIRIPIDLLIFAQENNPNNHCKINNKFQMKEYFREYFLSFGEDENKGSDFECLLDKFFSDATESDEDWIDFIGEYNG
jgi:hypothetical protein